MYRLGDMMFYKLAILFLDFLISSVVTTMMINFFFDFFTSFSIFFVRSIAYSCVVVCIILVGSRRRRQDMTSLKQRTATFRFRHDYRTQDRADRFVKHRLETLLRQS